MVPKITWRVIRSGWALTILLLIAGCSTAPKKLEGLVPGRGVESLQSPVSISIVQGGEKKSARGYLLFKRPDLFHLAILAPFGQTLLDLYSHGDRVTCIVPGKRTAYSGRLEELPELQGVRLWGLMRWLVERPLDGAGAGGEQVQLNDQGLVTRRTAANGDSVSYGEYAAVGGIAFPMNVELSDRTGMRITLVFDEPEVNGVVDEGALTPVLDRLTVLPLTSFQGF